MEWTLDQASVNLGLFSPVIHFPLGGEEGGWVGGGGGGEAAFLDIRHIFLASYGGEEVYMNLGTDGG